MQKNGFVRNTAVVQQSLDTVFNGIFRQKAGLADILIGQLMQQSADNDFVGRIT